MDRLRLEFSMCVCCELAILFQEGKTAGLVRCVIFPMQQRFTDNCPFKGHLDEALGEGLGPLVFLVKNTCLLLM